MAQPHGPFPNVTSKLSAAHARALAARLKTIEDFCGEIERLIEARDNLFSEYRGAIAGNEKKKIQAILRQVYERLRELRECFGLPRQEIDRLNAINAYLSELWVCLSETQSRHLKAYGPPPEGLAAALDPRIAAIDAQVKELQSVFRALKERR